MILNKNIKLIVKTVTFLLVNCFLRISIVILQKIFIFNTRTIKFYHPYKLHGTKLVFEKLCRKFLVWQETNLEIELKLQCFPGVSTRNWRKPKICQNGLLSLSIWPCIIMSTELRQTLRNSFLVSRGAVMWN